MGSKFTFASMIRTNATFSRRSWFWNVKPRSTQTSTSYSKEDLGWKEIQNSSKDHGLNTTILQNWRQSLLPEQTTQQMDLKWRPEYRIVHIEHDRHFLHIENQATRKVCSCNVKDVILEPCIEFWNIDTQFGRAGRYINHPANLPTIKLND